jgi:D-glycero-alpha-D-manno-heptose-7-phosphate kinase
MIITRSPLRVSLGGGGTDLPSYYREFGGFLVAAAIDKYVYITLHQTFVPGDDRQVFQARARHQRRRIEHPIIREAFKLSA